MPPRTDMFELSGLHLAAGEGRRLELSVAIPPLSLGGERYEVGAAAGAPGVPGPAAVPALLDVARIMHGGYSLRLRFTAPVSGPCMRCLGPADPSFDVDAREIWQPGEGEELTSPYLEREVLDLRAWARDALALALPSALVCREDCPGLCPVCGVKLDEAGPDHVHERPMDSRWAKLSELRFD